MKNILSVVLTALITVSVLLPVTASAAIYNEYIEDGFYSECVLLVCTDNDEVIFSLNPNKQTMPASLTKVITASVVLSECTDLSQMVTVPESCIEELVGTGSSLGGLKAGETLSVRDLLHCLLIQSANEAATTLAYYVTGEDRDAFIAKMNDLAAELGCTNSHFVNVHGLDDEDQYTTVTDMAKFFENAKKYDVFNEIVALDSYELPETNLQQARKIRSTNFTLLPGYKDYYCEHSTGGKTGSTSGAGRCLVSASSYNGYNYIAVAMNGPMDDIDDDGVEENGAFVDTKAMYDWAYENLRLVSIADAAKVVGEIPVRFGRGTDHITLCPAETAYGLMPKGIDATGLLIKVDKSTLPEHINAPVHKEEVVCKGDVYYADQIVARIDLVSSTEVKRGFFSSIATFLKDVFVSPAFRLISIAIIIALVVLVAKGYFGKKKKESDKPDKKKKKETNKGKNK